PPGATGGTLACRLCWGWDIRTRFREAPMADRDHETSGQAAGTAPEGGSAARGGAAGRETEALRASEERLRLILGSATDYAIFTTDLDRRVTTWNEGARRLLGWGEEMVGRSADSLFTPEDRGMGAPEREAAKALSEGRAENERWHLRKNGTRFWGSGLVMPL